VRRTLLAGMFLLLAGCLSLQPKPDPTQFFLLTPAPASQSVSAAPTVGLHRVTIPDYLDQSQLVRRVGPDQVEFLSLARWAEPLASQITRVLANDLAAAAGLSEVPVYPWARNRTPSFAAWVTVHQFERERDSVLLVVTYRLEDSTGAIHRSPRRSSLSEPAESISPAATVSAMNRALTRLSKEMVEGLSRGPQR
jgi:uncharacterized lipoprotein YmbA